MPNVNYESIILSKYNDSMNVTLEESFLLNEIACRAHNFRSCLQAK